MKLYVRAALVGALLLSGCTKPIDDRALFEQVRPLSDAILADPQRASPRQVGRLIARLEEIARQVPGRYGGGQAEEALARLYLAQGQFTKARDQFTHIFWYYSQYADLGMTALLNIARSYEAEQNWEAAEKAYKTIDDHYLWSPLGLGAALFPGEMYERAGDRKRAVEAYQRAVLLLRHRAAIAPSPETEAKIKMHLATAYERLGQWRDAAGVLEAMVSPLQEGVEPGAVLMQLADLYAAPGRDMAKARAALTRLVQEFSGDPLAPEAKAQLERLDSSPSAKSESTQPPQ